MFGDRKSQREDVVRGEKSTINHVLQVPVVLIIHVFCCILCRFSMPLSEIDFSQCRRCSPSYRALPGDYPRVTSSERSETDDSVLNDMWVSVPTGSEDFSNKVVLFF
jgi:hypothetical protein